LLYTWATFAAGVLVRPFGARVFRFGRSGGNGSSLLPLFIMGASTVAIGMIPGYGRIGIAAPVLVLLLRLLQGLALGGSFPDGPWYLSGVDPGHRGGIDPGQLGGTDPGHPGGFNSPDRRGSYTSWAQASAALGLFLSLGVVLLVRHGLDADTAKSIDKFNDWGWRVPFLVSPVLTVIAINIRTKMKEWPAFPVSPAAVGHQPNLKMILLATFGLTMGQGVVFYTGGFYVQSFLESVCRVDPDQAKAMLLLAVLFATPFFILFAWWSDRIGRKWIMMAGLLLAVATWPFLFRALQTIPDPAGRAELSAEKEIVSSVSFIEKSKDLVRITKTTNHYEGGLVVLQTQKDTLYANNRTPVIKPVVTITRKVSGADYRKITGILFLMIFCAAIIGGPVTAFLAERSFAYPSLPYVIGDGIAGGMTPFIATLLTTIFTGHALAGLWYPMGVGIICLIVGVIGLPARRPDAGKA